MTEKKLSPFDIVNNINDKTGFLDVSETGYDAFVVNRCFSNVRDSVFFANEMNAAWGLPKDMQYSFMYFGLPKGKRFGKWYKPNDEKEKIALLQEYYGLSTVKAKIAISVMDDSSFSEIQQQLEKGGRRGSKKN